MQLEHVGIVGSGIMGSGVAEVALLAGFQVTLRSRTHTNAHKSLELIERSLQRKLEKEKITPEERSEALLRLTTTTDVDAVSECQLVIESISEDLKGKKSLFSHLDEVCAHETVLATNTSTLPIIELAAATNRADRVCGIHFFNPAPLMGLVEVIPALTTSASTLDLAVSFVQRCRKEAVVAKDEAGFIVNSLLFPYLNSAITLFERGTASMEAIDASMRLGCGYPMGPFQLLDLIGLDTSLAILEALHREFGTQSSLPAPTLKRLVASGRLGRKTGHGFYSYDSSTL
ncbi:MAG: 3-hydroxyacyl-CoA dehydrogenase family protein [Acidimicrobiales bacterium]